MVPSALILSRSTHDTAEITAHFKTPVAAPPF